jgi:hypothetical protein
MVDFVFVVEGATGDIVNWISCTYHPFGDIDVFVRLPRSFNCLINSTRSFFTGLSKVFAAFPSVTFVFEITTPPAPFTFFHS